MYDARLEALRLAQRSDWEAHDAVIARAEAFRAFLENSVSVERAAEKAYMAWRDKQPHKFTEHAVWSALPFPNRSTWVAVVHAVRDQSP